MRRLSSLDCFSPLCALVPRCKHVCIGCRDSTENTGHMRLYAPLAQKVTQNDDLELC